MEMEASYYAMQMGTENGYQYNGKELNDDFGLNWNDYGARWYMADIGRWGSVDPLADMMAGWSPYSYTFNNPLKYTDPTGMAPFGDFLDKNGKLIGNDGKTDGKVYVVKTTEKSFGEGVPGAGISKKDANSTIDFIKDNSGNTAAFEGNPGIYNNVQEIEGSATTRQEMVDIVGQDNGKGGTSDANNREYGGTIDLDGKVTASAPGPVRDPSVDALAEVTHSVGSNTKSTFHSHPSGEKVIGPANSGASSGTTIGGQTTTHSWGQPPSSHDVQNAGQQTHYVFGMKGTVYIYNNKGVTATIPIKNFVNPKN
jgi:RHS repeat-associated protein